jgi:hypothetical protein
VPFFHNTPVELLPFSPNFSHFLVFQVMACVPSVLFNLWFRDFVMVRCRSLLSFTNLIYSIHVGEVFVIGGVRVVSWKSLCEHCNCFP